MSAKILTKEIAEQFIADEDSVDLTEFTKIDEDAAEVLSNCSNDLFLDNLVEISDDVAKSFARHSGRLVLSEINELSDVAVESIVFGKITAGSNLHVGDPPEYISIDPPEILSLKALKSLSVEHAKIISSLEVCELYLDGLTYLSNQSAEILSQSNAQSIYLEGLTSLSNSASISLSKFNGTISVPSEFMPLGARVLTKEIAHQLIDEDYQESINAKYEYKLSGKYVDLEIKSTLWLMGVEDFTHIEDDAAEVLTRFRYNEDDDEKPLFYDTLELNGLVELSESAAEHLCGHLMDVELKGLSELSDAAAKSLAKMDSDKIHLTDELEAQVAKYR